MANQSEKFLLLFGHVQQNGADVTAPAMVSLGEDDAKNFFALGFIRRLAEGEDAATAVEAHRRVLRAKLDGDSVRGNSVALFPVSEKEMKAREDRSLALAHGGDHRK